MKKEGVLQDEAALSDFAHEFTACVQGGKTLCLSGPLGAGKTTFVRCLLKHLGSTDEVSSPTYVIQNIYQVPKKDLLIEHWDLYRTQALPEELSDFPKNNVFRIVEWGEKFELLLEMTHFRLEFSYHDDKRYFRLDNGTPTS